MFTNVLAARQTLRLLRPLLLLLLLPPLLLLLAFWPLLSLLQYAARPRTAQRRAPR